MTPENFCFWLQGMFELTDQRQLDEKQTRVVREHLALVFEHVTGVPQPSEPGLDPEKIRELERLMGGMGSAPARTSGRAFC